MELLADIVKITEITQNRAAGLTKENITLKEILDEELKKFKKEKAKELCRASKAKKLISIKV